jgi:hypothetical protein
MIDGRGIRAAAAVLVLAVAARAGDLATVVRMADRDAARRVFALAQKADAEGQRAVARELFARALELQPESAAARLKLGFKQTGAEWKRTPEQEAEVNARTDADAGRAAEIRKEAADLEDQRVKEIVRLCKERSLEERRPFLLPLLEQMPDRADVHEALGHVQVGEHWVPPELAPAVRMMPLRLQAWRNYERDPVKVEPSSFGLAIPGVEGTLVFRLADECEVASAPDLGAAPAEAVARVRGFLRFLLGDRTRIWTPPPVVFLGAEPYGAMVHALHPDPKEAELYGAYENYEAKDFYAIRVYGAENAAERYAHGAGYLTMCGLVAERDADVHAWLLEGFGYLASLEVFDAGNISFSSIDESKAKAQGSAPPPEPRTRDACLAWVRGEMRAGRGYPLAEICARSINDLDLCASLESYSFVRFLFLLDPEAARNLPGALREAKGKTQPERVDAALRASYGKGLGELEALWRAFP